MTRSILPGGGYITIRSKVSVNISAMKRAEKLIIVKSNDMFEIQADSPKEGVEILSVKNGRGSHTPEHIPLVVIWGSDSKIWMRMKEAEMDEEQS